MNKNISGSSSDEDSDSSSSLPALIPRKTDYYSSSSEDDDSKDDRPIARMAAYCSSSSDDDDDSVPGLVHRHNGSHDDSSDDDSLPSLVQGKPQKKGGAREIKKSGKNQREAEQKAKREAEAKAKKLAEEKAKKAAEEEAKKKALIKKQNEASIDIACFMRACTARLRFQLAKLGFTRYQALVRGFQSRNRQCKHVVQFLSNWRPCWIYMCSLTINKDEPDWSAVRVKQTYIRHEELVDHDDMAQTDLKLHESMQFAMDSIEDPDLNVEAHEDYEKIDNDFEVEEVDIFEEREKRILQAKANKSDTKFVIETEVVKCIYLSDDVVRWLKTSDAKYRDFFIRRMKQLSSGERSRILAKRLKGSVNVTIYEIYLEQKSGFRILWTEKDNFILIWYVSNHKKVSHYMKLIDASNNRSDRNQTSISKIQGLDWNESISAVSNDQLQNHHVFLDPCGNVPLKVYGVETDKIDDIIKPDWTPGLYLTDEEREVVETKGTVLLLGRSGTGKTVCICNRMEHDKQINFKNQSFKQLFVARSTKLKNYVRNIVGEGQDRSSDFKTFSEELNILEAKLPTLEYVRSRFPRENKMDFRRFKTDLFKGDEGIDALIIWTNIRSFIKGSIEATVNQNRILTQEQYLSSEVIGKKRCRLSTEKREVVYDIFLRYQNYMESNDLWDDCDRINALITRLLQSRTSQPDIFEEVRCSKIYVDEVQDYIQSELLLFFYLSGAGDLFLAGDSAQNVVEGVEFRFEDIRSVGYHIAGEYRHLIPQKPKVVNMNFRSHAGILNAAAAILGKMFNAFPDSAKQLGKDDGVFKGPRPGVFNKVKMDLISSLVNEKRKGTVILTHDRNVKKLQDELGGYQLVYGIRAAKGLEFKNVIVLDFFNSLPQELQKPWRELLLERSTEDFCMNFPEVEGQLKLLYTAVTRCIETLFFAETTASLSGAAFVRWMTTTSVTSSQGDDQPIATLNNITNIENMTMTQDEWLAAGIANADAAEAEESNDLFSAQSLMQKAIFSFDQCSNNEFSSKAKIHLESMRFREKFSSLTDSSKKSAMIQDEAVFIQKLLNDDSMWQEAAIIMGKLLEKNLLSEAFRLCKDLQLHFKTVYKKEGKEMSSVLLCELMNKIPEVEY